MLCRTIPRYIKNPVKHLKMDCFAKTVNGPKLFTIFVMRSILLLLQSSEYTNAITSSYQEIYNIKYK